MVYKAFKCLVTVKQMLTEIPAAKKITIVSKMFNDFWTAEEFLRFFSDMAHVLFGHDYGITFCSTDSSGKAHTASSSGSKGNGCSQSTFVVCVQWIIYFS